MFDEESITMTGLAREESKFLTVIIAWKDRVCRIPGFCKVDDSNGTDKEKPIKVHEAFKEFCKECLGVAVLTGSSRARDCQ